MAQAEGGIGADQDCLISAQPVPRTNVLACQVTQWLLRSNCMAAAKATKAVTPRDPDRSKERILTAALKEFSARGFAGTRVDRIACRAAINKRMLYHYFGDKEGLFRAVLRRKIAERQAWNAATPEQPAEYLPLLFDLACKY